MARASVFDENRSFKDILFDCRKKSFRGQFLVLRDWNFDLFFSQHVRLDLSFTLTLQLWAHDFVSFAALGLEFINLFEYWGKVFGIFLVQQLLISFWLRPPYFEEILSPRHKLRAHDCMNLFFINKSNVDRVKFVPSFLFTDTSCAHIFIVT